MRGLVGISEASSSEAPSKQPQVLPSKRGRVDVAHRAPRVKILPLHPIEFRLENDPQTSVQIGNFSTSGVGFLRKSRSSWPEAGAEIKGNFLFEGRSYPAKLVVVHASSLVVGCSFVGDKTEIENLVSRTFSVELKALRLSEVRSDLLKPEPIGRPHWFLGGETSELYFVEENDRLLHMHLAFLGHYVEFNQGEKVRFGQLIDEEDSDKPQHKGSQLVRYHQPVPPELVQNTIRFLENITGLSDLHRKILCDVVTS